MTAPAPAERSLLEQHVDALGGPERFLAFWEQLDAGERQRMAYDWRSIARPKQLPPPGLWQIWMLRAGRGFGKTRTGSEFVRMEVEGGRARRIALVARTAADTRDVMVEGPSGILAISPPWFRPKYEPSKRRVTWPNGALATLYSAEEPDLLRGPEHDLFWADELASWKRLEDTWDNLQFGLRRGHNPRGVVTTTPRGLKFLRQLEAERGTVTTRGSLYENTKNLPGKFVRKILDKYEGTRLGRQEIYAEILDDNPAALWKMAVIEALRLKFKPDLRRVGIGIDPAVTHDETSNETGIIVAGVGDCRCKGGTPALHAFVFDDRSGIYSPAEWADATIKAYVEHKADRVVPEVNQGGDLVEANLRANGGQHLAIRPVHASKGKHTRAEPVAALYEQGKVHHVGGFAKLEDEMTQWDPLTAFSPNRLDALVHIITDLVLGPEEPVYRSPSAPVLPRRRSGITG